MCATSSPAASTSIASAGQSFLSRLALPLRSRTRNLSDFHIRLKDPYRKYSPGDVVKGAVVVTIVKPVRVTHITACLHGFVRVYKNANNQTEPQPTEANLQGSNNPRRSQYLGNGHASLFQDEVTLCGEGRLEAGVYEFNFELEFPSKGIPTSIDFERGTIAYLITATVTRPTSIGATTTCDQKVSLVERVDVGTMPRPRLRTISLEPIAKRKRRKTLKSIRSIVAETTESSSGSDGRKAASLSAEESGSQPGSSEPNAVPRSPGPSEVQSDTSADSIVSGSTSGHSFAIDPVASPTKSAVGSQDSTFKGYVADKTIVANIELLKSGCLPGDTLPVKIYIKHTKAIKSMHGVIITFYRQGRIDSSPPLSLFMDVTGKEAARLKHEEYYPKSRTGLGGLSLMSAGSSSVFRKDLSQTFAPLIVDPNTLTAVVNASIRVPEDVFPTIAGVPGEMISFKYYVEVVLDLGGRLAGQQRHVPRVGTMVLPSTYGNPADGRETSSVTVNANMLAAWGGSIVDTDNIRREKSVVACLFDVTVGTLDSARKRLETTKASSAVVADTPTSPTATHDVPEEYTQGTNAAGGHSDQDQRQDQYHEYQYENEYDNYFPNNDPYYHAEYDPHYTEYPRHSETRMQVPPPELPDEAGLDEKERIRRAEERLLPSQPPQESDGPSSSRPTFTPSAPLAPDFSQDENAEDLYGPEDATPVQPVSSDFMLPDHTREPGAFADSSHVPTAPTLDELTPPGARPADDKQELERHRLLAEASAPLEFPPGEEPESSTNAGISQFQPSAPFLTEDDGYGPGHAHADAQAESAGPGSSGHNGETLPRYER